MKTKFAKLLLILASAFIFTSCGDSKEKVINDSIDTMEELAEAYDSGDTSKVEKLKKEMNSIEKRADKVGIEFSDLNSLPEDQKKRFSAAFKKYLAASLKAEADKMKGMIDLMQ